ncbi:MAG: response regulator [Cyanobacteria bacterium P01_F01_bin.150]
MLLPKSEKVRKTKILLAEDNRVNQKIAALMLSNVGYVVDIAGNGIEVLEALERQPYQIILMDIEMPEMDGLTTTQRIQELYPAEDQPYIIALTASAMQGDRERFLSVGMQDYLAKPFEKAALLNALLRAEESIASSTMKKSVHAEQSKVVDQENSPVAINAVMDDTIPKLNYQTLEGIQAMLGPDSSSFLAEVIDTYLIEAPQSIDDIISTINKNDDRCLVEVAHKLRSSSASLGLERVAYLCETLEKYGRGYISIVPSDYEPHLHAEYEAVKSELIAIKDRQAIAVQP